jgi:hypothetical protein
MKTAGIAKNRKEPGGMVILPLPSGIVEKRHEAEIHVKLLVAMEEGEARIVGREIDFDFLIAVQHHHVLQYP